MFAISNCAMPSFSFLRILLCEVNCSKLCCRARRTPQWLGSSLARTQTNPGFFGDLMCISSAARTTVLCGLKRANSWPYSPTVPRRQFLFTHSAMPSFNKFRFRLRTASNNLGLTAHICSKSRLSLNIRNVFCIKQTCEFSAISLFLSRISCSFWR